MRLFFATSIFSLVTSNAFASFNFECVSTLNPQARVLVQRPTLDIGPTVITVQVKGATIYSAIPVVEQTEGSSLRYFAPTLRNGRNAPADLFLQIYQKDGQLLGEFSEQSYVPVVPNLSLKCREI